MKGNKMKTQKFIVDSVSFEVTTWVDHEKNMVDVEAFAWVESQYLAKGSSLERIEIATYSQLQNWIYDFVDAARAAIAAA
jgi:hypothetical protein